MLIRKIDKKMLKYLWIIKINWIGSNIRFFSPPPLEGNNLLSTKQKLSFFLWIEEKDFFFDKYELRKRIF